MLLPVLFSRGKKKKKESLRARVKFRGKGEGVIIKQAHKVYPHIYVLGFDCKVKHLKQYPEVAKLTQLE